MMSLDIDMELLRRLAVLRTAVSGLARGDENADEARAAYEAVEKRAKGASEQIHGEVSAYAPVLEEAIEQSSDDAVDLGEMLLSPLALIENLIMGEEPSPAAEASTTTESEATTESESLDDLAAFLVQLEPTLMDSLTDLRDRFKLVVEQWEGSDEVGTQLREALSELDGVASKKRSRKASRVEVVEKVGHALELAMDAEEEAGDVSCGSPAPNATPDEDTGPPRVEAADPSQVDAADPPQVETAAELQVDTPAFATSDAASSSCLDSDPDLVLDFVAEGLEYLDQAEEALLMLEQNPSDEEAVNVTFRAFHTIKGVAAFLEFTQVAGIAHEAETLLSQIRDKTLAFTGAAADLFLRSSDVLRGLLISIRGIVGGDEEIVPEGTDELIRMLADPDLAGKVARGESLGVERSQAGAEPESAEESVAQQTGTDRASATGDDSVRIKTERLDRLVDLVGELVVSHSMVGQDPDVLRNRGDLAKKVDHSQKLLRELQDLSTSLRMVPLKPAFHKVSRVVRDVARRSGKKVHMVATGDDTELDRSMVALITDPLVHMVRNSVDHGIESPEERKAAGKPEVGTLRLSARHAGGNVVVEIEDDGRGLDREIIMAKAVERGLVEPDRNLSDKEVWNFLFQPGFSTAAQVTDISGRGVGLDVVRRAVESLRGRIEIDSKCGQGSRFAIYLPLTLAITDGMLVRVGVERYIIPTVKIRVNLQPSREDLWTVAGRGEMVMIQEHLIPITRMDRIFDIDDCEQDLTKALLVVVGEGSRQTALVVDELLGQYQFVVKALTGHVADRPGIAGGAIMGDGGVGLILDPESIINHVFAGGGDTSETETEAA